MEERHHAFTAEAAGEFLRSAAPPGVRAFLGTSMPASVSVEGTGIRFEPASPGVLVGRTGDLKATMEWDARPDFSAVTWRLRLENVGNTPISGVSATLLALRFEVDPERTRRLPRVRHLTGSYHFDACYPPRAFRLQEEAFMTGDSAKPVRISSGFNSAYDHVPLIQYAVDTDQGLAGFFAGLEWSGDWWFEVSGDGRSLNGSAAWHSLCTAPVRMTSDGDVISGLSGPGELELAPGAIVRLPAVHLGFFEGRDWSVLDDLQRDYIRAHLSGRRGGKVPMPAVTYDHWYGIREHYDFDLIRRQIPRAAEIGCEFFCLDASWYGAGKFGSSGTGRWDEPDPAKFPRGDADVVELSELARAHGMGFGLWHDIEIANGAIEQVRDGNPDAVADGRIAFHLPAGRELALRTLRKWITRYDLSWMRWEFEPCGGTSPNERLAYMCGKYEVMDRLREEFPSLRIEGCDGGGTNFDPGMSVRTDSTWLSDHTVDPHVVRFMQTGALRFWPAHLLNMAVPVPLGGGDSDLAPRDLLSRMVGALSFNGDIAGWSPAAAGLAREYVDTFKENRHLMAGPVSFPLPQPRSTRDWDAVVFGGPGGAQLLYVFRMDGPEETFLDLPPGEDWKRIAGDETARIAPERGGFRVRLPRHGAALWRRAK